MSDMLNPCIKSIPLPAEIEDSYKKYCQRKTPSRQAVSDSEPAFRCNGLPPTRIKVGDSQVWPTQGHSPILELTLNFSVINPWLLLSFKTSFSTITLA